MRYAITFIVAVVFCFLLDVSKVHAEEWHRAGLTAVAMSVDLNDNTGVMIASWNGDYPLEIYENKWLDFTLEDNAAGKLAQFEMWLTVWEGVCTPPCEMKVEFIMRNVTLITK